MKAYICNKTLKTNIKHALAQKAFKFSLITNPSDSKTKMKKKKGKSLRIQCHSYDKRYTVLFQISTQQQQTFIKIENPESNSNIFIKCLQQQSSSRPKKFFFKEPSPKRINE